MRLEHALEELLADTFAGQRRAVAHERLGAVCVVALAAIAGHDPARVRAVQQGEDLPHRRQYLADGPSTDSPVAGVCESGSPWKEKAPSRPMAAP